MNRSIILVEQAEVGDATALPPQRSCRLGGPAGPGTCLVRCGQFERMRGSAGVLLLAALGVLPITARATVAVSGLYGSNMVLQRGRPVPVWGTAAANKIITVGYSGQTKTATADTEGNWLLYLDAMAANTNGSNLTITEAGGNTLTMSNVVVGDVWLCSGQSNMVYPMANQGSVFPGTDNPADITNANFPGIRMLTAPVVTSQEPLRTIAGSWSVCSPETVGGFSAVAFYFGRKIYQDQSANVPIGLITTAISATTIDIWLAPEGLTDIPVLQPLYNQTIMPAGPFSAFNGMVYPFAPFAAKGMIWYQGEGMDIRNVADPDSYYLKEKALQQGWKRALGLDDFAFYVVLLADWMYWDPVPPTTTPEGAGSWPDIRAMQTMVLNLPHAGVASALDVGDTTWIHPKDKLDVGERLALWALKNDYGRSTIVPSGPTLRDVTISGATLICAFDYVGAGLMAGSKTPHLPTVETNAPLV